MSLSRIAQRRAFIEGGGLSRLLRVQEPLRLETILTTLSDVVWGPPSGRPGARVHDPDLY